MTKQLSALALALAVTGISHPACAEGNYVGIGFSPYSLDAEANGSSISGDANVLEGYYGFEWNDFFAAELRLGFGLGSGDLELDSNIYSGDVGKVKITSMYGLYAKPQFKSGGFKAYALLGYAGYSTETTIEYGSYSESEDTTDDGFSYGIGAGFDFGQHGIALEWKTTKIDGGDISGVAAFYQYQF